MMKWVVRILCVLMWGYSASATMLTITDDVLLSSPLVGIAADASNLYAHGDNGVSVDYGKNLSFEPAYANSGSVQDAGNMTRDGVSHSLELRNGTLTRVNNANEDDFHNYTVGNGYVGVGDAVELDGVWQVPLVKNLGGGTNRMDLVNLTNGSITPTDLLFTHANDITGMGNTQATALEDLVFFFTDTNKQILEANTTLGVVEVYYLNGDYGNLQDVSFDSGVLWLAGDDFGGLGGRVCKISGFTPSDPDPAHTEDGVAIAWLRANGIVTDFEEAGALDPDDDGYTTAQEYILGTAPANALSRLNISINATALEFSTTLDRLYEINSCNNLVSNAWNTATNDIPGTGETLGSPVDATQPAAFYRVKVRRAE